MKSKQVSLTRQLDSEVKYLWDRRAGSGATVIEAILAFGQIFLRRYFIDGRADLIDLEAARALSIVPLCAPKAFARMAISKTVTTYFAELSAGNLMSSSTKAFRGAPGFTSTFFPCLINPIGPKRTVRPIVVRALS